MSYMDVMSGICGKSHVGPEVSPDTKNTMMLAPLIL